MRRGSGNLGSLIYSIFFIYREVNKKSPDQYFEPLFISFTEKVVGHLRESNPRPLVPKTRIIPLDQSDNNPLFHFQKKWSKKTLFFATLMKSVTKSLLSRGSGNLGSLRKVQPRFELGLQESKPYVITIYTIRPKKSVVQ